MRIAILNDENVMVNIIVADEETAEALHPGRWVSLKNIAGEQGQVWNGEAFEDVDD